MTEFVPEKDVRAFFALLNENEIRYILIKNIADELPVRLKNGKDVVLIVHPEEKLRFSKLMSENGFLYRVHPFGSEQGWKFAYGLEKHQFWQKRDCDADFYIDVCFRLCCKSLTPNTWVPLDEKINGSLWEDAEWNETLNCSQLDEKRLIIYLIVRSVFDKRKFSETYISEIEKRKNLLDDAEVRDLLPCVFYKFTESLILLMKSGRYGEIIHKFLSFKDY